jgi:hypothetical protein
MMYNLEFMNCLFLEFSLQYFWNLVDHRWQKPQIKADYYRKKSNAPKHSEEVTKVFRHSLFVLCQEVLVLGYWNGWIQGSKAKAIRNNISWFDGRWRDVPVSQIMWKHEKNLGKSLKIILWKTECLCKIN